VWVWIRNPFLGTEPVLLPFFVARAGCR